MNPARIAILVVAAIAAIGLALVVRNMVSKPKPMIVADHSAPSAAPPMVHVLTAKQDLSVGDRLSPDNMGWQPWPAATLNAAFITDGAAAAPAPSGADAAVKGASKTVGDLVSGGGPALQSMVGAIVKETIYAGEPITARKIVRGGDSGYMAVRLPPGTRAMSIPVNVESGAGGFIQPGDRVDVLDSHQDSSKGMQGFVTETVLSNAIVLAIDQTTDPPKSGRALIGAVATLEVPAAQAEALARAKSQGGLVLALRSYADIGGGATGEQSSAGHTVRLFKGGAPAEVVISR